MKSTLTWSSPRAVVPVGNVVVLAYRWNEQIHLTIADRPVANAKLTPVCGDFEAGARPIGWVDLEALLKARASKTEVRTSRQLPPWSNRSMTASNRYSLLYRFHPLLARRAGTHEFEFVIWGLAERPQDRVRRMRERGWRHLWHHRPVFRTWDTKEVIEREELAAWLDPMDLVLRCRDLMRELPGPVTTVARPTTETWNLHRRRVISRSMVRGIEMARRQYAEAMG